MARINKIYSVEVMKRYNVVLPVIVVLYVLSMFVQSRLDPTLRDYHKEDQSLAMASSGLNNEFLLLPLLGFREATAGLLWVRCDEFFHSGDYDAILPLVRLITWLDPHAENVYVTGAWHLSYNFTDSSERSDRRYIAPSQALLDEGIRNNMNIPDIKFEKGWENYDKIKDYNAAEEAFKLTIETPPNKTNDDYPYGAPLKTWHSLAHTYAKQGRIPEALQAWQHALDRSAEMMKAKPGDYSIKQLRAAEQHNYDITMQRYYDRYTTKNHDPKVNWTPYPAVIKPAPGATAQVPWDIAFKSNIEVTRPRVLKISGAANMADGGRIFVRISDWDYKEKEIAGTPNNFTVDMGKSILIDSISVRKNKFEREMDMSKDPKMYSFSVPTYRIVLTYDARSSSPHEQDRFGYNGEGMTDVPDHVVLSTDPKLMGTKMIEGQDGVGPIWDGKTIPWPHWGQPERIIRVTYKVTKEQILGQKPITDKDLVSSKVNTSPIMLR